MEVKKQIAITNKTSLTCFLLLSNIIIPSPEFTNKPDNKAPNDKEFDIYSSLIRILEAQLGISPINEEYKGARYLFDTKKLVKLSSPTAAIIRPNTTLIRNT